MRLMLRDRICVVRLRSLSHLPPAQYAIEALTNAGLPVTVVEFDVEGPTKRSENDLSYRLHFAKLRYLPRPLRAPLALVLTFFSLSYASFRNGAPLAFYSHGIHEQPLCWLLSVLTRKPWIAHVHEVYDPSELKGFNRVLIHLERLLLNSAAWTIFPSEARAEIYRKRYALSIPIYIVPNCPPRRNTPPEPVDLRRRLDLRRSDFLVGYLGGIGRWNALEETIRAIARLPEAHLVLWGWGDAEYIDSLKSLAAGVGCRKRVHFLGPVGRDKWSLLAGVDVSLCLYEPGLLRLRDACLASNKFMESLACAVPVLTSGAPDFRRYVEGSSVGVCAPELSVQSIAEHLRYLMQHTPLRERMKKNAFDLHHQAFYFERYFGAVCELFTSKFAPRAEASSQAFADAV